MYGLFLITYSGSYEQGTFETMASAEAWIEAHAVEVGGIDEEESYELDAPDGAIWFYSAEGWWQED